MTMKLPENFSSMTYFSFYIDDEEFQEKAILEHLQNEEFSHLNTEIEDEVQQLIKNGNIDREEL